MNYCVSDKNLIKIGNWSNNNEDIPINYYCVNSAAFVFYYSSSSLNNNNFQDEIKQRWMYQIKNCEGVDLSELDENQNELFNKFFNKLKEIIECNQNLTIIFPPFKKIFINHNLANINNQFKYKNNFSFIVFNNFILKNLNLIISKDVKLLFIYSDYYNKKKWKNVNEIWKGFEEISKNWKLAEWELKKNSSTNQYNWLQLNATYVPKKFIFIDDILTSGSTLYFIIKKILERHNDWLKINADLLISNLFVLSLSKTYYDSSLSKTYYDNNHFKIIDVELSKKLNNC